MPIHGEKYRFVKRNVDLSPDEPGVYALFIGERLIYYGEAHDGTIRARLQRHLSGAEGACTQQATHYKRESCADPEQRELDLPAEFQSINGRLPRCNERMG